MFLCRYIKEWRRNPHWSFSCCLTALLPLNDLHSEIRGLVEANVLQNQLKTGKFEKPTILSVVKDCGVIDVNLKEYKQDDDDTVETDAEDCQGFKHGDTRCHRGTQTELFSLSIADIVAHKTKQKVHKGHLYEKKMQKHSNT